MQKLIILLFTLLICQEIYGQFGTPQNYNTLTSNNIPTVTPANPFNATEVSIKLRLAMQSDAQTFEQMKMVITEILVQHNREQRYEIAATYQSMYGEPLLPALEREYHGKLFNAILDLFSPAENMYARGLREAIKGLGTDEDTLIEILVSLDKPDLVKVAASYEQIFQKNLAKDIRDDTSGFFRELLLALLEGRADETSPYPSQIPKTIAEQLKSLEPGSWRAHKDNLRDIFCKKSFTELRAIFDEYQKLTGQKIEDAIEREFKKDSAKTLLSIVKCARNRSLYFAEQLGKAITEGSTYGIINRIIIGRSEIDLGNIKEEFVKNYGKGLNIFLKQIFEAKADTSQFFTQAIEGHYWNLILKLAGYDSIYFKTN